MWSSDRIYILYQLKLPCVKARRNKKQIPLNISTKRFYGDLTVFCRSRLGINHKPGSFRNNGNTLRYNINSTSASKFTMYFAITKSEYWKSIFVSLFYLSDMKVSKWTDTWPILGRHFADTWPTLHRYLADTRPILGRHLADTWPIVDRQLIATYRPMRRPTDRGTIGRQSVDCRPTVDRLSADSRSTVDRYSGRYSGRYIDRGHL